jgi:hypothetical protein
MTYCSRTCGYCALNGTCFDTESPSVCGQLQAQGKCNLPPDPRCVSKGDPTSAWGMGARVGICSLYLNIPDCPG